MKKKFVKKLCAIALAGTFVASSLAGCTKPAEKPADSSTKPAESGAPAESGNPAASDTFIADRKVTVQVYVDDIGYSLPEDLANSPVIKELKKRTGIDLEIQYTPGDKDAAVLASQLASGTIPDVIISYLNNSTRPEFPLLLKAAREDMFADVSEYIKNSKVYSKYLEDGYLPTDTKNNVMWRDEFGGKVFLTHLQVDRIDKSLTYEPDEDYIGGLYIQRAIVDKLGIKPNEIRTQDQFYDLLVKIRDGGFKDKNGNPVIPLGPKFWGGSTDALGYITNNWDWGYVSEGYNMTEDGKILHEVDTDYALKKVNFVRKLLDEKLINPEFFTMDATRAEEVSRTGNSGIIADVHNYKDIIYETGEWQKLGPLDDFTGSQAGIKSGKTGNGAMAISADAENPEEIFKLFDYLASKEGQMLSQYGVEGLSYTMVDGQPRITEEIQAKIDAGENDWLINNVGAGFGGSGCMFFDFALTDKDPVNDFGESRPGAASGTTFAGAVKIGQESPPEYKLVPGLSVLSFVNVDELSDIKTQMALVDYKKYKDVLVQAMFASSEDEAVKILNSFKDQLKAAGNDKLIEYVTNIYKQDPTLVAVMPK